MIVATPQKEVKEINKKLFTRDAVNQILSGGNPPEEELEHFPLGQQLKTIPEINERYSGHIPKVFEGVNILLSDHPHYIVKQWRKSNDPIDQEIFTQALISIFGTKNNRHSAICQISKRDFAPFFRLMAMYHDIGKCIIHERHPLVGWHLIKDVYRDEVETELYPLILGIPYDEWIGRGNVTPVQEKLITIFEANIKFHDLFGVLSTGEASLPVMVDLIPLTGMDPESAKELFSILFLFNLADLYGSVPEILPEQVNHFCDDWKCLCDTIEKAEGNRDRFFTLLYEIAKTPERTIERITRFMNEGAPKDWRGQTIDKRVVEVFKNETLIGRKTFYSNFALFCKLDYALAFKKKIMQIAQASQTHQKDQDVTKAMGKILWLLIQLERQYGDLCKRNDGSLRRIGLQMAGLTRKPATGKDKGISRIGDAICKLLLNTEGMGKEWALSECTVWFMEQ